LFPEQVSDGPNGEPGVMIRVNARGSDAERIGIRGNHFFMGTPAKCLPVRFGWLMQGFPSLIIVTVGHRFGSYL
jgi:hypothetical protein